MLKRLLLGKELLSQMASDRKCVVVTGPESVAQQQGAAKVLSKGKMFGQACALKTPQKIWKHVLLLEGPVKDSTEVFPSVDLFNVSNFSGVFRKSVSSEQQQASVLLVS
eukprot:2897182-Amphidinium_carterae.1